MFLEIPELLTPEEVRRLRDLSTRVKFVDGRATNPHSQTKNNLQLDHADPGYRESAQILHAALARDEQVRNFVFPKMIAPPLMTKYTVGMNYGEHADAAFLNVGQARPMRSDLSCTIFLNDPDSYDGGELSVLLGTRRIAFKPPAGGAIIYPSTTLHQVIPVTRGERLTAITFMESQIVDQTHRELLYQINEVMALEGFNISWENRTRLSYVSSSLHRLWGDAG
jgi:PKHD-type hydroxylase